MIKIFSTTIALAMVAVFLSSAQAAIKIEVAEVQNGFAFVQGNNAASGAQITWEGNAITTANKNNCGFSFNGAVPADCIGSVSDGVSTINVQVLNCTPVSAAPAPVPRTGQTISSAAGDDGALKRGVAWPTPRFTDNSNGTITDKLTGLIWLKNANCFGRRIWADALADVTVLNSGECGLTDGSVAADWRMPNRNELTSLLNVETLNPPLPAGHPFTNFVASNSWSSTTSLVNSRLAWAVNFGSGFAFSDDRADGEFVTAVRGGS